jgi:hypothetical protein
MNQLDLPEDNPAAEWLWHGLIGRGNVTLLTSRWKAGKTTLITGLLQQFATGGAFLDRRVTPARVLVVSEETRATWSGRLKVMPVGPHCELLPRPFPHRPTCAQWHALVDYALDRLAAGQLDLLVIDPLARFLPGSTESDLNTLLAMLDPLQRLTEGGAGVLILHHPRKKPSEDGSSARGNGGLLAAVDIILELTCYGKLRSEERRRQLIALSRFPETPRRLYYEWDPAGGRFSTLADPIARRFRDNWPHLRAILAKRTSAATHQELLMDWPADLERPSPSTLYEWLNRAFEEKLLRRKGSGLKTDPYRYRLENADDEYYDRGELPPLKDLGEILRERAP